MQRYFVKLKNNDLFKITGDDYHHIVNVMRMKEDSHIEISYKQELYLSKIKKITNNEVLVKPIKKLIEDNDLKVNLIIAQAIVKEDKFATILKMGTQLGVKRFIPLILTYNVIKIDTLKINHKVTRWQKICKEASEQSKRETMPVVDKPINLTELIKILGQHKWICSTDKTAPLIKNLLSKIKENDTIVIVIGPEGGFTHHEENLLSANQFTKVSLGKRILRTETVSLVVASMINYELMR